MFPTRIKKAIFPVAGLGTRFLPATKANPKEMLPIVDKPLIQYAVEEALSAGIEQLIFVTSSAKRSIEDHFDSNYELESKLEKMQQYDLLNTVRNILPEGVSCVYVRQPQALGLGHAVMCARNLIGNEAFVVLLADDLMAEGADTCLEEMVSQYLSRTEAASIIAVEKIAPELSSQYGVVALAQENGLSNQINQIVEKPSPDKAPSDLGVVGRYILTPAIFNMLDLVVADSKGEIQLTDAISRLLEKEAIYACTLKGQRYDCGSKLGYLKATVDQALKHAELAQDFKLYLESILNG